MPKFHNVQVTVHDIVKGKCSRGFKIGNSWLIKNAETPGGMCSDAYTSIYPAIRTFWLGGKQPWDTDSDITYRSCPDAEVIVIFEIKRLN
jgi:uncharacterized repeat protein (TIGR04076 family)